MHIEAADICFACFEDALTGPIRLPAGSNEMANGVEQKCAGAARRIEHSQLERIIDGSRYDAAREPIRSIIFTEVMPLIGIDETLIEDFQNIGIDIPQAKS